MQILKVTDEAFRQYGKVIKDLDVSDIITAMSETPCPDDVVYEPSIERSYKGFRRLENNPCFLCITECNTARSQIKANPIFVTLRLPLLCLVYHISNSKFLLPL